MRRLLVLGALLLAGGTAIAVASQQATQVIDVTKVADNYFVLGASRPGSADTFSGGNVGVFITQSGVVLVDTKLAAWGGTLMNRVRAVSRQPVTMIINTHTHADHTGNNDKFGVNVEVVAHENTKANMEKMDAFKGENARFLPKRTYADRLTLGRGAEQIDLYYFGRGHTNGDTWVVFPALRVLQTGDIFAWKDGPRIDRANGGSGVQYPQTIAKAVSALKDIGTVVPGHSPLMTMKDVQEYGRYTADLLKTAQDAKDAGRSVDDAAIAAIAMTQKYPGFASERVKQAVQDIYDELNAGSAAR
jgi:glyoxylase-like metal-dependent hydrolase (beta-lactamase superfamily II)